MEKSLAEWKGGKRTQAAQSTNRPASKTNQELMGLFGKKSI